MSSHGTGAMNSLGSMNIRVCQLCFEDFDTDINWPGANHKLPVSCSQCPNTVCFQCYQSLQRSQKRNIEQYHGIRCPRCSYEKAFPGQNPSFNRALCMILLELGAVSQPQQSKRPKSPIITKALSKSSLKKPRSKNKAIENVGSQELGIRDPVSDDSRSEASEMRSRRTEIRVSSRSCQDVIRDGTEDGVRWSSDRLGCGLGWGT